MLRVPPLFFKLRRLRLCERRKESAIMITSLMRFCWLRRPFRSFPLWKRLSPWGRRCTLSIWALTSWSFPWWSHPRSSLRGWSTTGGSWRSGRARTRCWSSDRALRRSDEWCRVRSVRCRSTRHSRRSRAMRIYGHNDIVQYLNHDSKMADREVVNTPHSAWSRKNMRSENSYSGSWCLPFENDFVFTPLEEMRQATWPTNDHRAYLHSQTRKSQIQPILEWILWTKTSENNSLVWPSYQAV